MKIHLQGCGFLFLAALSLAGTCSCKAGGQKITDVQSGAATVSTLNCPVLEEKKLVEHRLTADEETRFSGPAVRAYIRARRENQFPSAVVVPPAEFNVVVEAGKDAIPFLLRRLSSVDEDMKQAAAIALERITNQSFLDQSYMRTSEKGLGTGAWEKVSAKYEEWWKSHRGLSRPEWLIEDTASQDIGQRRRAILELGEYHTSESQEALSKCLLDPKVQIDAAESLARLGDRRSIPVLATVLLPHDNPSVRNQGICLLQSLTGQTLGFDPNAPASSRAKAIDGWKLWIQQNYPGTR
jgi:HEAT repeat protein